MQSYKTERLSTGELVLNRWNGIRGEELPILWIITCDGSPDPFIRSALPPPLAQANTLTYLLAPADAPMIGAPFSRGGPFSMNSDPIGGAMSPMNLEDGASHAADDR
jgi:hypothetical protein